MTTSRMRWLTSMRLAAALLALAAAGAAAGQTSSKAAERALIEQARAAARPLTGTTRDYDALLAAIGTARIVMLGEATHGSREFYRERARITRRLIEERGFRAVVFEAPWEPMRRLDAYVRGAGGDADAAAALQDVRRFPRWMWRNEEVREFAEWLRAHNGRAAAPVRLFGMDLYSVPESARAVADYLAAASPNDGASARRDYRCFEDHLEEPQGYGHAVVVRGQPGCGAGARRQLALLQIGFQRADAPDEALFAAWQSAHTVAAGENYYRAMHRPGESSWNVRERYMADTLDRLLARLAATHGDEGAKLVVWAHNTHQGDARATDQAAVGEVSIGQLMRERHEGKVFLVGFSTHAGAVRAAPEWGGRDRVRRLRPVLAGSWSALLHKAGLSAFLLDFTADAALAAPFAERRLERAVGVAYLPHDERASHYFGVRLSKQFDALIHWDATGAVAPLAEDAPAAQ